MPDQTETPEQTATPGQTELAGAYRRLLWCYPRFYRRLRGPEIVTTMLDAAKPGQTRPTRADAIHLILSGLKVRLVPPGWIGKVAAGVVTLWAALVLGGVGAYAVWQAAPTDTPDASIVDSAVTAAPGQTSPWRSLSPLDVAYTYHSWGELSWYQQEGWLGPRPYPDGQWRRYQTGTSAQEVNLMYQRLRDQGWQTGTMVRPHTCQCTVFWASRDDVVLRVTAGHADAQQTEIFVGAHRAEPGGVFPAAIAGFVIGLLLAWPVMTWLAHRVARARGAHRALALLSATPVLVACAANTVDNVLSMAPDPDAAGVLLAVDLMYPLANQVTNPLAAIVIFLGLAMCVAVTGRATGQTRGDRLTGQGRSTPAAIMTW